MANHPLMHWLADGLPITLLCDLFDPEGPDSAAVNAAERPAADPVWHDVAITIVDRDRVRPTA